MDWVDSTDDATEPASALRQPFEVLRPVPTQETARVQKVQTGRGKNKHQALLEGELAMLSRQHYDSLHRVTVTSMLQKTCCGHSLKPSQMRRLSIGPCVSRHTTNAGQLSARILR